ncbi:hypothetical protein [uncultured Bacteroides sp.]|uniref:hypothetical protein n=1 Tax=uncultured Bacteroides sp. TaxID=162156 RepID=UPI0025FB723A|nr:hypothetical protein [uncultured Bacteroides sp.]
MANESIAPERIIDAKLYEQLQTLQKVKLECGILFAKYSHQGVDVPHTDEVTLYEDLDCCMRTLAVLAGGKYEFDLKKGGAL